ncbi:MAG: permease, partial [Actinomycetota bacterium]|nr:permease [Actinomycetota bacterium]
MTVRVLAPSEGGEALPDAVRDFVTLTLSVLIESLPFVFLGILLSIAVQVWVPQHVLHRLLPHRPGLRRLAISLLGILLPVCECGNVPLSRGLIARGFSVAEAVTFLLAAPILNPVTIIVTYQVFGWDSGILLARILGALVIANLVGWLFSRHPSPESMLTPSFVAACRSEHGHVHGASGRLLHSL